VLTARLVQPDNLHTRGRENTSTKQSSVCFSKLHIAQLLYSSNTLLLCGRFPARVWVLLACSQLLMQLMLPVHC
jgi:hypothetical protein